jgi:hypothetical protein
MKIVEKYIYYDQSDNHSFGGIVLFILGVTNEKRCHMVYPSRNWDNGNPYNE